MRTLPCRHLTCDALIPVTPAQADGDIPCQECQTVVPVPPRPSDCVPHRTCRCRSCSHAIAYTPVRAGKVVTCPSCSTRNIAPPLAADAHEADLAEQVRHLAQSLQRGAGVLRHAGCIGVIGAGAVLMVLALALGLPMVIGLALAVVLAVFGYRLVTGFLRGRYHGWFKRLLGQWGDDRAEWMLGTIQLPREGRRLLGSFGRHLGRDELDGPLAALADDLLAAGQPRRRLALLERIAALESTQAQEVVDYVALVDRDAAVRCRALELVAQRGDQNSGRILAAVAFWGEEHAAVAAACEGLAAGDGVAQHVLLDMAASPAFAGHRQVLSNSLCRIEAPAGDLLVRAVNHTEPLDDTVLTHLLTHADNRALSAALRRLVGSDRRVPPVFYDALVANPDPAMAEDICTLLRRELATEDRVALLAVLAHLDGERIEGVLREEVHKLDPAAVPRVADLLARSGPVAVAALAEIIDQPLDLALKQRVVQALASSESRAGYRALRDLAADPTREDLHEPIIAALAHVGSAGAIDALAACLGFNACVGLHARIVQLLVDAGGRHGLAALAKVLDQPALTRLHPVVVETLAIHGGADPIKVLAGRLGRRGQHQLRGLIMSAFAAQRGDEELNAMAESVGEGEDLHHDMELVEALAATGSAGASARLFRLLDDPRRAALQPVIVRALGEHGDQTVAERLVDRLDPAHPVANRDLCQALGRLGGDTVEELLLDLAGDGSWPADTRHQALDAAVQAARGRERTAWLQQRLGALLADPAATAVHDRILDHLDAAGWEAQEPAVCAALAQPQPAERAARCLDRILAHPLRLAAVPVLCDCLQRADCAAHHRAILEGLAAGRVDGADRHAVAALLWTLIRDPARTAVHPPAVRALAHWGDRHDADALRALLDDPQQRDAHGAVLQALAGLGDTAAVDLLCTRFRDAHRSDEREELAALLAVCADRRARDVYREVLADRRLRRVWEPTIDTLGALDDADAARELAALLRQRRPLALHHRAVAALTAMTSPVADRELADVLVAGDQRRLQPVLLQALRARDPADLPQILQRVLADPRRARLIDEALDALADRGDDAAVAALGAALDHPHVQRRGHHAIDALRRIATPAAVRVCAAQLADPARRRLHLPALDVLTAIGGPDAVSALGAILTDPTRRRLHALALDGLNAIDDDSVTGLLERLLADDSCRRLHVRIREALPQPVGA